MKIKQMYIFCTLVLILGTLLTVSFLVSQGNATSTPVTLLGIPSVPVGSIWMWSQTYNPPFGWYVCDATNNSLYPQVPNLSGKFILCYQSGTYSLNATGGATTATLGITNMPSHSHNAPTNIVTKALFRSRECIVSAGATSVLKSGTSTVDAYLNRAQGSGTAFSIMPTYRVCKYIIYLGV